MTKTNAKSKAAPVVAKARKPAAKPAKAAPAPAAEPVSNVVFLPPTPAEVAAEATARPVEDVEVPAFLRSSSTFAALAAVAPPELPAKPAKAPKPPKAPKPTKAEGETSTRTKVAPDAVISAVVENPKKAGSRSHARFALYVAGKTVADFVAACVAAGFPASEAMADISWDRRKGFITVA